MQSVVGFIRPKSNWRILYHALYLLCTLILMMIVIFSKWLVVSVGIIIIVLYYYLPKLVLYYQPLHIAAPSSVNQSKHWQLLFKNQRSVGSDKNELWEAKLLNAMQMGHCVHLSFAVIHPEFKLKRIIIWQDQVTADVWRQLNIVARWS